MGFDFVLNEDHASDSDLDLLQVGALENSIAPSNANGTSNGISGTVPGISNGTSGTIHGTSNRTSGIIPASSNGTSGIIPGTSGSSGMVPGIPNSTSGIVPGNLADNPGISSIYATTVGQEEEKKAESPHDFFCQVVNEFPVDIMEPPQMLRYLHMKIV